MLHQSQIKVKARADRYRDRLLKFLRSNGASRTNLADGTQTILSRSDGHTLKLPKKLIQDLLSDGLISEDRNGFVSLSSEGAAKASRLKNTSTAASSHSAAAGPRMGDGSPLTRLYVPSNPAKSYLTKQEYHSGERLRIDFEKSHVSKSLGIDWNAIGMPRQSGGFQEYEASDFADNARMRVARALNTVGPELSGVLLDVCCFLKGLEQVEADRQWPRRSAKLLLKVALATLDRHYNPPPQQRHTKLSVWHETNRS
ncbi:MAG: DUF6456 domain-containing protein [Pseudomonadota bacterium]